MKTFKLLHFFQSNSLKRISSSSFLLYSHSKSQIYFNKFRYSVVFNKINNNLDNFILMEKDDYLLKLNYEVLDEIASKSKFYEEKKISISLNTINKEVKLSENEKNIFDFLLKILKTENLNLTLRVAGGWVRDKLMNKESDDIDIALDSMSGESFAKIIKKELDKLGFKNENLSENKALDEDIPIGDKSKKKKETKIAVIKTNPEKSKHLETATMKIFGQQIDFVNLRTEKYSDESRIPTIEIGTPKEDALRRDITINSLFYNINKGEIEDFIGTGISDIENQIIRTPINPFDTFKDDPLRILRCVRFAVRFGFNIMNSIIETASDKVIKDCLNTKVSNERVRKELKLTFASENPFYSVAIFYKMNVLEEILKLDTNTTKEFIENKKNYIDKILNLCFVSDLIYKRSYSNVITKVISILSKSDLSLNDKILEVTSFEDLSCFSYSFFNLCLVLPFNKLETKIGKKTVSYSEFISAKALMLCNDDLDRIKKITSLLTEFCQLKNEFIENKIIDRLKVALLIRKLCFKNLLLMTLLSISNEYTEKYKIEVIIKDNKLVVENNFKFDELTSISQSFFEFLKEIDANNLIKSDEIKPIIDGDEVMNLFNLRGNKISLLLAKCIEYQVLYPKFSKQEIIELVSKIIPEL